MPNFGFLKRSYWWGCCRILLLCPLLVSCNTLHMTYSKADWILLWKLDKYFDLSGSQEKYLDQQIESFHIWHRQTQLPTYVQFLEHVDDISQDGLSQAELENLFASVEHFRGHLAKRASSPGAEFLATLSPAQIRHFEDRLNQDFRRLVSEIGEDSTVRLEKRTEAATDTLTSWVGELSVDQETYIRKRLKEIPDSADVWLTHRRGRQQQLLELLRSSNAPFILEQGLYQWLADFRTGATDEYRVVFNEWRAEVEKAILDIDRILTLDQRAHFFRKLQGLIQDIKGLVG
jgi:hypothetical protein